MDALSLQQISMSLGLGMLLGLQRERIERSIGGIRTFPFISLLGTVCAMIGAAIGTWIVPAGLLALAALVVTANLARKNSPDGGVGLTTEIAALLVYVLGVVIVVVRHSHGSDGEFRFQVRCGCGVGFAPAHPACRRLLRAGTGCCRCDPPALALKLDAAST